MKVILFLCRFTFICNVCFLLFVFFRWQEKGKAIVVSNDSMMPLPIAKDIIISIGFPAIIINVLMNLICIFSFVMRRKILVPGWILIANFLFLIIQIIYFFFI